MVDLASLTTDLAYERESLAALLRPVPDADWSRQTPAEGWTVRDQVSHLAFEDDLARLAVVDPESFAVHAREEERAPAEFTELGPTKGRSMSGVETLRWWEDAGTALMQALDTVTSRQRVQWFGVSMSAASFVTARLMETWAHGQDVADALGAERQPTARLRSIAHLGVAALPYSYRNNGKEPPTTPVRVELAGPNGERWTWGDSGGDRVTGDALDFCLVVTRRRHLADTDLVTEGPHAREWMEIAQAYAGPPGSGRRPGQFRR